MILFDIDKGHEELAISEIEAVTGKKGVLAEGFYRVDMGYSSEFEKLGLTKEIRHNGFKTNLNKKNKFMERRSHLLPAGHPSMASPKLARAMVNLSCAKKEILDPFCGAGGILVEAGLVGLNVTGFDIDALMLERAKLNLEKFGIRNYTLERKDATTFDGNFEAVVTDLPYGKNTKINDEIENLYLNFLKNLARNKIKKAVIGFPDFCDYRKLISLAVLTIEKEFSYYLHRSLSKRIVILKF